MGILSMFKKKEQPAANPISKEAAQKILDAQSDARKSENFSIAGTAYHQEEIISNFGTKNPLYSAKISELRKAADAGNVYEYTFRSPKIELIPEPDNEYDPNAIAVYADGVQIGYIKKGSTARIRNILKTREVKDMQLIFRGGNYKYTDFDGHIEKENGNVSAKLNIVHEEK